MEDTAYSTARVFCLEYGFNVIPLQARGKTPPEKFSWKKYQTERVTEEQLEAWHKQYPGCNWGVVCGAISDLVVFDADDERALNIGEQALLGTPLRVRTGKGWHLYYRYPDGREEWLNKLNLKTQYKLNVDLQRDGKYVVCPGSIHESGKVYTMENEFPDWNYVPAFDLDEQKLAELTGTRVSVDLTDVDETSYGTTEKGNRNNALAKQVGKFCKKRPRLPLDEVKRLSFDWNQDHLVPPLGLAELERTVESIYNKDKKDHPDELDVTELSDMDGLEEVKVEEVCIELPDTITHPTGLIGEIAADIKATSVRTTDVFAVEGALALLSFIACQKFKTETGLTTNEMYICVGSSGLGKDAPKSYINKIVPLLNNGKYNYRVVTDVASDPALLTQLNEYPHTLFCFDEIGMLFKSCSKPNSPRAGLVKTFTELYSNTSAPYTKVYASKDNNKTINGHALVVQGMTVPGELFQGLSNGETTNGFLARHLPFIDDETKRLPKNFKIRKDISPEVIEKLSWLAGFNEPNDTQCEQTKDGTKITFGFNPILLYMSEEAYEFLVQKSNEWDEKQEAYENEGNFAAASLAGRAAEHAIKLSIVYFISREYKNIEFNNTILLEDMQNAWKTADWCTLKSIYSSSRAVSETEFDAFCQKILLTIEWGMRRSASKAKCKSSTNKALPGATYVQLSKALPGVPDEILKKAIRKLRKSNQIALKPGYKSTEKSKRPVDLYVLVREKDETEE